MSPQQPTTRQPTTPRQVSQSTPAQLTAHHPDFRRLFAPNAQLEQLAGGFTWLEGPTWVAQRNCVVFSDVRGNATWRWSEQRGLEIELQPSHHQNGHCTDATGRLVACSHGQRALLRQEWDGRWTVLADRWQGRRLNSPNDVALAPDGSLWFSDPLYGLEKPEEGYGGTQEQPASYVYRVAPDGSVSAPIQDRYKPNGLAFTPSGELLVADTGDAATYLYHVEGSKATLERELFRVPAGKTDGLRVDHAGRIWSSGGDGVYVLSATAELLGHVQVPQTVANLCFGGKAGDQLFITASEGLYRIGVQL